MFNVDTLISIVRDMFLGKGNEIQEPEMLDIDARTIRYYTTLGLLSKPIKVWRGGFYDISHVKQLLSIKLLQTAGYSLKSIQRILDTESTDAIITSRFGFSLQAIEEKVALNKTEPSEDPKDQPEEIVEQKTQGITQIANAVIQEPIMPNPTNILVEVSNNADFTPFNQVAKFGDNFVFVDKLPEVTGKALHRMLFGQKSTSKAIERAVLPIDDELFVPGATLKSLKTNKDSLTITVDKDVYKENDDIVRAFIFDPIRTQRTVNLEVTLDGASIEKHEVKIDKHGCGLIRFQALAAGEYTIQDIHGLSKAKFTSARYELDPLTVTLSSPLTKCGEDGKSLLVQIKAEAFSSSYNGPATAKVMSGRTCVHQVNVEFKEGLAQFSFVPTSDDAMNVQVTANGAIASVPLSGSSRMQREDTEASALGKVVSVSMVGGAGTKERGLFFKESGINNSPVTLKSCVADKIVLNINGKNLTDVHVMVRQPNANGTMTTQTFEVIGKTFETPLTLNSPFASVHVGAFVDGKPWEGHAMVVRKARFDVTLSCENRYQPSDTMVLKIKSKKDASVLLRIADKRMRTQETPMTAAATRLKEWIGTLIGGRKTGNVSGTWTVPPVVASWGHHTNYSGDINFLPAGSARRYMMASLSAPRERGLNLLSSNKSIQSFAPESTYFANSAGLESMSLADVEINGDIGFPVVADSIRRDVTKGGATREICDGLTRRKGGVEKAPKVAKAPEQTRESDCDLIYTGLIEVVGNETKELNIKLPDTISNYDIQAFAVSHGDWIEAETEFAIDKGLYVVPVIPAYAHPEDNVKCRAYIVADSDFMVYVSVDGKPVDFKMTRSKPTFVEWDAVPGVHEVSAHYQMDSDTVTRVVECPGEESVLAQQLMILKKGESFDILKDENALSIQVVPGMDNEFKAVIHIVTDFQHKCCEQTAAALLATAMAIVTSDDSAEKEKAYDSIIKGKQRLENMFVRSNSSHFLSYPGGSFYEGWSGAAAKRCSKMSDILSSVKLPNDVQEAVDRLTSMGKQVLSYIKPSASSPMEDLYYNGGSTSENNVDAVIAKMSSASGWDYSIKSEAAFYAAALIKNKKYETGIKLANACAKAIGGAMGGAMHGSYECLAYLHLIDELKKAGIVSGAKGTKVSINGKETNLEKAMATKDVRNVKATEGAIAIKVTRLERIKFDEVATGVQMSVDVASGAESVLGEANCKANSIVSLKVKIGEYKDGDVLCVALPNCLSMIVAGAKVKKFQLDFKGKKEVAVDLVAHDKTAKNQRWAAVVRNMYDSGRIGSVGTLQVGVK